MRQITITIGIPVYNEQENISAIIKDILSQRLSGIVIHEILIDSDGSTDETIQRIRSIKDKRIAIIENKVRKGVAAVQNEIFQKSKRSDYLILLNGDVRIFDMQFIQKVVSFARLHKADLTAVKLEPVAPSTRIEKILKVSVRMKRAAFEKYSNGENLFTCCGPGRVFSQRMYTKIRFNFSIDEDAYSYLYCKFKGFRYAYCRNTVIYYRLPSNFADHKRQSMRFFNQQHLMDTQFGEKFIRQNYNLPLRYFIVSGIQTSLTHPVEIFCYFCILLVIKAETLLVKRKHKPIWEVSSSTKHIDSASY